MELLELEAFFGDLCDAAAGETLPRFRSRIDIANKEGPGSFDPVTEGDRQAEKAIRRLIEHRYPNHGIVGEEFGTVRPEAEFQWIIDPIDGTRAFISGLPVWGTLIGLFRNGKPFAGCMDQPFTRERYLALPDDGGAMHSVFSLDGSPSASIQTRNTLDLSAATLMTTSPHILIGLDGQRYEALEKQVKLARYGCDCYAYCMVAGGHIDLVVESGLNIYDIAALIPIVEGAGGCVTDWEGRPLGIGLQESGGHVLAAGNAKIRDAAIAALAV